MDRNQRQPEEDRVGKPSAGMPRQGLHGTPAMKFMAEHTVVSGETLSGIALKYYDVKVKLAAPETLRMKPTIIDEMKQAGIEVKEVDSLNEAVRDVDVVYMTRIQKERFPDIREYDAVKGKFRITMNEVKEMLDDTIILHPLPRVDEIDPEVDSTPQAKYFDQVYSGVVTRMAIIKMILG